jgi:hypothetical protein
MGQRARDQPRGSQGRRDLRTDCDGFPVRLHAEPVHPRHDAGLRHATDAVRRIEHAVVPHTNENERIRDAIHRRTELDEADAPDDELAVGLQGEIDGGVVVGAPDDGQGSDTLFAEGAVRLPVGLPAQQREIERGRNDAAVRLGGDAY